MKNILTFSILIVTAICFAGPVPGPVTPAPSVITSCINSNCRCTETTAGCLDCIFNNCDSDWDDDEDKLYNWWCRNRSKKGC